MTDEENQRSLQRIFNKSVRHCIKQGKRCLSDEDIAKDSCAYYDKGRRCAIGGAVDVRTAMMLEYKFVGVVLGDEPIEPREIDRAVCKALGISPTTSNLVFLSELQGAHDNATDEIFEKSFLIRVGRVAERYDLEMPALS